MLISVVYYIFLNPEHEWRGLLQAQMKDLVTCGLSQQTSYLHVMLSGNGESLMGEASAIVTSIVPRACIHRWGQNHYEYPGIKFTWELANCLPDPDNQVILYHHSKGMVNSTHSTARTSDNINLTNRVVMPWREIVAAFHSNPKIMKAGHIPASGGWIWYNFWWARASYLRRVKRPLLTDNRYYYESWLAQVEGKKDASDCYSVTTKQLGYYLDPPHVYT